MGGLREHFGPGGYAIHRAFVRIGRLPRCCRSGLEDTGRAMRYLGASGEEIPLPLRRCGTCGRIYAVDSDAHGEKYMPVENLLKAEILPDSHSS
jgi:hypothetical protein